MKSLLTRIYDQEKGHRAFERIQHLLADYSIKTRKPQPLFSEKDVILITYGDSLKSGETPPLNVLHQFAVRFFQGVFSTLHLLPFFPYSSDDGFSVIDFYRVDEDLGDWSHIEAIGQDFKLMFDFVLNHISAQSDWFAHYLAEKPGFEDLAIETDPSLDLSVVTRPRSLPLLTPFVKASGETVHLWTTFSADQVDLNFRSLEILEKMLKVMLFYVEKGADILRLDAVAYLWKEIGTTCIHLPQTHDMIRLFRLILDQVAPEVMILTETNVPHPENISYFGNGQDEAQMVYNFTLPPLLLHTFIHGDASDLSGWASELTLPSPFNTFFNFTASHDGIGVRPLEGILSSRAIDFLVDWVRKNGGRVSTKQNSDGSESPYELNITYLDAYYDNRREPDPLHIPRFLASQSIQCALPGVPAVYIHSILGSRNWQEGVAQTGRARTINREKLNADQVAAQLSDPDSFRARVYHPYAEMIRLRRRQPAFHPNADFTVLHPDTRLFAIRRTAENQELIAVTNVTSEPVAFAPTFSNSQQRFTDVLTGRSYDGGTIELKPYQYAWLQPSSA